MRFSDTLCFYRSARKYLLIPVFLLYSISVFSFTDNFTIEKPISQNDANYCGDRQFGPISEKLSDPVRIKLTDSTGMPVNNVAVIWEVVSVPDYAIGFSLKNRVTLTGSDGISENSFILGNKEGEYIIAAKTAGSDSNIQVFKFYARKSNWVFFLVIGLIGGLGLFLFGVNYLSEGLQKSFGDRLRTILSRLTNKRLAGIGAGSFFTTIIQSSSAVSVMLISFVQSGLMSFRQTVPVIIGAALGTTITIQLVAFRITDYSLLFIAVGFLLQYLPQKRYWKYTGQAILGLGILFFGLYVMSEAIVPLKTWDPLVHILTSLENPFLGILAGMIFTALTQSASAFIGIIIILASQGLLSLEAGIPLLIGANVGTSVTAIIAAVGTGTEAKKVAVAHTLYRVFGMLLIIWWIPFFAEIIRSISPGPVNGSAGLSVLAEVAPRQIANAHTVFYLVLTLISLPLIPVFVKLADKIIPRKPQEEEDMKAKYLDENIIGTPSLALSLAKQEAVRMGYIVQDMLNDVMIPFLIKDGGLIRDIEKSERNVNYLHERINNYLLKLTRGGNDEQTVKEAFQMMYVVNEFEQIGDIISTNLLPKAAIWVDNRGMEFSEEGKKEIVEYHTRTQKQISRALEVFRDINLQKAKVMKKKFKEYSNFALELERSHFERLKEEVTQSISSSKTHIELIGMLNAISRHATNVARIMLKQS